MRRFTTYLSCLVALSWIPLSSAGLNDLLKQGEQLLRQKPAAQSAQPATSLDTLTLSDGLKEALKVGGERAISRLSSSGGYLNSADVKIPLPGMLQTAASTLRRLGMSSQVDAFEKSMNNAAEQAVAEATPLFIDTISGLTLEDAKAIYTGGDTAATDYFRNKTSDQLAQKMRPLIEQAMESTGVTRYYSALMEKAAGAVPMLAGQTPDLGAHVTDAAMKGLFLRLGQEERQIRQNPVARSTDLLKKVFSR